VGTRSGRSDAAVTAAGTVVVTPAAVGLDAFAAVEVVAGVMQRSAHACAWLAAANLDANGVPHAQPAENLSMKTARRCRESRWRLSEAKLAAVYVHSVHVKHGASCTYTERTEAG
jgi:hypothetical protein